MTKLLESLNGLHRILIVLCLTLIFVGANAQPEPWAYARTLGQLNNTWSAFQVLRLKAEDLVEVEYRKQFTAAARGLGRDALDRIAGARIYPLAIELGDADHLGCRPFALDENRWTTYGVVTMFEFKPVGDALEWSRPMLASDLASTPDRAPKPCQLREQEGAYRYTSARVPSYALDPGKLRERLRQLLRLLDAAPNDRIAIFVDPPRVKSGICRVALIGPSVSQPRLPIDGEVKCVVKQYTDVMPDVRNAVVQLSPMRADISPPMLPIGYGGERFSIERETLSAAIDRLQKENPRTVSTFGFTVEEKALLSRGAHGALADDHSVGGGIARKGQYQ